MSGNAFQVKLSGEWSDFSTEEDKILKRTYLAGYATAGYSIRGQKYETDFQTMQQKNQGTGKQREIRLPFEWKAVSDMSAQTSKEMF